MKAETTMQENGDPNQKLQANPGYVVNQLLRAMSTSATHPDPAARQRALERVKR
jgi:phage tail protein X